MNILCKTSIVLPEQIKHSIGIGLDVEFHLSLLDDLQSMHNGTMREFISMQYANKLQAAHLKTGFINPGLDVKSMVKRMILDDGNSTSTL